MLYEVITKLPAITREMSKPFVFTVDAAISNVLGKSGKELYAEWAASLKDEYEQRIAPVLKNRTEGEIIAQVA